MKSFIDYIATEEKIPSIPKQQLKVKGYKVDDVILATLDLEENFVVFPNVFGFALLTEADFSAKIKARTSVTDGMWSTTGEQRLIFADRLGCSKGFSVRTALILLFL